eukprot:3016982-Amphidinium_carterae.1
MCEIGAIVDLRATRPGAGVLVVHNLWLSARFLQCAKAVAGYTRWIKCRGASRKPVELVLLASMSLLASVGHSAHPQLRISA